MNLGDELRQCLRELDAAIAEVRAAAERQGANHYAFQSPDGAFLLGPLLVAKADILTALARHPGVELERR